MLVHKMKTQYVFGTTKCYCTSFVPRLPPFMFSDLCSVEAEVQWKPLFLLLYRFRVVYWMQTWEQLCMHAWGRPGNEATVIKSFSSIILRYHLDTESRVKYDTYPGTKLINLYRINLHQLVVWRSCCMLKPQLYLGTHTDKILSWNSKPWSQLQHQNWMSHILKCFWCRFLYWTPTTIWKCNNNKDFREIV